MKIPEWIVRNLEENGNCAIMGIVNNFSSISELLTAIEKEVGFKVQARFDGEGYILEKVKNNG